MRRLRAALALVALLGACSQPAPTGKPRYAASSSGSVRPEADYGRSRSAEKDEPLTWKLAVRLGLWHQAASLLDALPTEQRDRPELRFVRATVAMKLRDPERSLELLGPVSQALPSLRLEVEELEVEALAASGRHLEAAKIFARRSDPESLLRAARAYRRAERDDEAMTTLAQAFTRLGRANRNVRSNLEAQARALRSQWALESKTPAAAAVDLRWLALEAPTRPESADAAPALDALGGSFRLKAKERYARAMAFASQGMVEATERELALIATAPGAEPTTAQKVHAQGWAWYLSRTDYDEAARLLHAAAAMGGADSTRDRFYAARALARAARDVEAIEELSKLVKDSPRTPWAEEATYLVASLYFVLGQWTEASAAFHAYVKRYGFASDHGKTASYSAAVAELAAQNHESASTAFAELVRTEANPQLKERYRSLLGAALAGKGDIEAAKRELGTVVRNRPFGFPALTALERLKTMNGAPRQPLPSPKAGNSLVAKATTPLEVTLPTKARLLLSLGFDAAAESALMAEEPLLAGRYAPRSSEALCLAYGQLWVARRRYQIGQRAVGFHSYDEPLTAENRWLWECNYPTPYAPLVRRLETNQGLPSGLVFAVMRQESAFRSTVESPAGAIGLMQLMPNTALKVAAELGSEHSTERLGEAAHNIRLGAAYLAKLQEIFRGNVALSISAYNAGPNAVSHWLESGEKLPLDVFVARIPFAETRNYTYLVLENLARYRYLASGGRETLTIPLELPKGIRAPDDAY